MYSHFASLPKTTKVRFSTLLWGLTQTVLGHATSGGMPHWMVQAINQRLVRIGSVISTLLLAMQAGTLRTRRSPAPGGTRKTAVRTGVPTMRLPGQFGWLVKLLAWHAAGFGSQLQHLLADPDMQALLAVSPRAVRTLKPLCRMLMIALPVPPAPVPPAPVPPSPLASTEGDGPAPRRRPRRPRPRAWTPSYNPPLARGASRDRGGGVRRFEKTASGRPRLFTPILLRYVNEKRAGRFRRPPRIMRACRAYPRRTVLTADGGGQRASTSRQAATGPLG